MVLSHYMLSPGKKKDVHAGPQVFSTRHCGTIGVERKEHYVHDLSHSTTLNYLYIVMLVCACACVLCCPNVHAAGCLHAFLMSCYIFVGARDVRGIPQRGEGHEMSLT